jgi:hypothetical protein
VGFREVRILCWFWVCLGIIGAILLELLVLVFIAIFAWFVGGWIYLEEVLVRFFIEILVVIFNLLTTYNLLIICN